MAVEKIDSSRAKALLADDAVYLDVRTIPEFEAGHAPGAYNLPLMHAAPGGMQPNPRFAEVVGKTFARDRPLVVACKAGGRSARACAVLEQLGFTRVFDFAGGWAGNATDPGWPKSGGETTTAHEPGHAWDDLER
ncbi:MAG TPA: rhodanese-like domain-containing protein [Nannocystaceae bacterium]|nr:rhodanese-like domain-containing protein [Nannocystaceae bacterium]